MTDEQREAEIKRVRSLLAEAQLDDDYEAAGRWARNWAALEAERSTAAVATVENWQGV